MVNRKSDHSPILMAVVNSDITKKSLGIDYISDIRIQTPCFITIPILPHVYFNLQTIEIHTYPTLQHYKNSDAVVNRTATYKQLKYIQIQPYNI